MKQIEFNEKLAIFAGIAIPILTILFGTEKSPFKYTLSMIGNWFNWGDRIKFIIWGIFTAIFIVIFLIHIFQETRFRNKKAYRFLYASGILLVLSVFTPTITKQPIPLDMRTLRIGLHEIFSVLFSIFLIASLYLFSRYLSESEQELSIKPLRYLLITVGGSILVLTIFGMTGIFEFFFFISLSIFLLIVEFRIRRQKKFESKLMQNQKISRKPSEEELAKE